LLVSHLIVADVPSGNHLVRTSVWCVEPSGVHVLKNPNPLKDVEASAMLDCAGLSFVLG